MSLSIVRALARGAVSINFEVMVTVTENKSFVDYPAILLCMDIVLQLDYDRDFE
jgi:hypothetical protein